MERKNVTTRVNKMMKSVIAFSLAMVMALAGMAAFGAKEVSAATTCSSGIGAIENADGTITVKIMAIGSLAEFDFGLVYDNTKVKVVDYAFTDDFISSYKGMYTGYDFGDYVVFGGVHSNTSFTYIGRVAYVTFSVIGQDAGTVMLVHDSAKYHHDFSNATSVSTTKVLDLND